jgi:hypothetical protein
MVVLSKLTLTRWHGRARPPVHCLEQSWAFYFMAPNFNDTQ